MARVESSKNENPILDFDSLDEHKKWFVLCYCDCFSAAEAYRRVKEKFGIGEEKSTDRHIGFKYKRELLPIINEKLAEYREQHEHERERIIAELQENIDIALGRRVVNDSIIDKDSGLPLHHKVYRYNGAVAKASLELMAKITGHLTEKVDLTSNGQALPTSINVCFKSPEE